VEDSLLEEAAMYLQLALWAKFETAVPTEILVLWWTHEIGINLDSDVTWERHTVS